MIAPTCCHSRCICIILLSFSCFNHLMCGLLQAGVAAIALGTQEKHDINVPIVPVGLTYFRGHRFRGRLVVEFGQPIYTSKVGFGGVRLSMIQTH